MDFESGTIPPIGLNPPPLLTSVEESLVHSHHGIDGIDETSSAEEWLVGGRGRHDLSTVMSAKAFCQILLRLLR